MQTVPRLEPQTSVHDMSPMGYLEGIEGLSAYASRALVCPGTAVVGAVSTADKDNINANHAWLKSIGVGAEKMILVEGENLRQGILCGPIGKNHMARVIDAIFLRRQPLSLFLPRDMEPLVMALGLDWLSVLTPRPDIAKMFDDKHSVRCLAASLGMGNVFPVWEYVTSTTDDLFRACTRVLNAARSVLPTDTVYLKVHDYDGGLGILRWSPETQPEHIAAFVRKYLKKGLIIDAGYPSDKFRMREYSAKVEISPQSWRLCYVSRQLVANDAHRGNEVAIGEDILDPAACDILYRSIAPLCNEAVRRGYGNCVPRTMGFDFMDVSSGSTRNIFLLAANARTTATDYAMAVCQQAAQRFGGRAAVVMENLEGLPADLGHDGLRDRYLKGNPWDGKSLSGYLIGNPACLTRGKATAFCIGQSLEEARFVRSNLLPKPNDTHLIRTFGRHHTSKTTSSVS